MGLSESSLTAITKPFSFLSHCRVSCDSPCCILKLAAKIIIVLLISMLMKMFAAIVVVKVLIQLFIQMVFQIN